MRNSAGLILIPCVAFRSQCFHDEYLPSFNLPSVQLVDTDGVGVERITPKGFVAAGQEFEVDCMIFATGFESGIGDVPGVRNMGYDLEGRGGVTLSEKWSGGPRTFRSYQSRGFPNCMMLNAPQGSFTANNVHNLSEVATHAAHLVAECLESGVRSVEPSEQAEEEYCARMYENSGGGQKFLAMCTPGCKSHGQICKPIHLCGLVLMDCVCADYNNEGQVAQGKSLNGGWGGPLQYHKFLEELRETGGWKEGLDIEH